MYRHRFSSARLIGLGALGLMFALGAQPAAIAGAQPAYQPALLPGLFLSGEQLPDLTRYSVTISNQTQATLSDLQVSVQLPDDAVFDHALETPGFTQFLGPQGQTLMWKGASFGPRDVVDAYTFFLAQPADGAFTVDAQWGGDSAGEVQQDVQPMVRQATDSAADITLDSAALGNGPVAVGNTGVVIDAISGQIPPGTSLHVHVLAADSNPQAVPGDLWWCSMVQIDGLPAGAGVLVEVPTRQPLPPEADVQLFGQYGTQWNALQDQARVSGDGQSILYVHHGGTVAAGTSSSLQPFPPGTLVTALPSSSPAARQILANKLAQSIAFQALAGLMVQNANCPPGNCAGIPACFSSALIAGVKCANGSIRAQGDKVQALAGTNLLLVGTTICGAGGVNCTGYVGLVPGGTPAPAGHGTMCTFPGFTQASPPGLTCSQF